MEISALIQQGSGLGMEVVVERNGEPGPIGCLVDERNVLMGVVEGTPAHNAGMSACVGRVLTHVDGVTVTDVASGDRLLRNSRNYNGIVLRLSPLLEYTGNNTQSRHVVGGRSPPHASLRRCAQCGKDSDWRCPCHLVAYCSDRCQKEHWPVHSLKCNSEQDPQASPVPKYYAKGSSGGSGFGSGSGPTGGGPNWFETEAPLPRRSGSPTATFGVSRLPHTAFAGTHDQFQAEERGDPHSSSDYTMFRGAHYQEV